MRRSVFVVLLLILGMGDELSAQIPSITIHDEGCWVGALHRVRAMGDCEGIHQHGHWIINYTSGGKAEEGDYILGRKAGIWQAWYESGLLFSESTYADTGSLHPILIKLYYEHENSQKSETTYNLDGDWLHQTNWDPYGRKTSYPSRKAR